MLFNFFLNNSKMLSRRLKKVTYPLRLPNLNSPCKRISTHIDVHEPSEDEHRLFKEILDDAPSRHICAPPGMLSPYKASGMKYRTDLNLCQTFWIFIFSYLFDVWLNLLNGFDDGVTVKTDNSWLKVSLKEKDENMNTSHGWCAC